MKLTPMTGLLLAVLLPVALPLRAEWTYREIDNQAENMTTWLAKNRSRPVNATRPGEAPLVLELSMVSGPDGSSLAFELAGGWPACLEPAFCTATFRFDGGSPVATRAGSSPRRMQFLVVRNPQRVLQRILGARQMTIEIPVVEKGPVTFSFDLSDFRWSSRFMPRP